MIDKVKLNTGESISKIGLGTMHFGSKQDKETSFQLLDTYFKQGGNFLDSANKYASWIPGFSGGESELIIGEWLKSRKNRKDIFVTSKVGFSYGTIPRSLNKNLIISECEKSLNRLGIDTIDMYFAHAYDSSTPIEETLEAFNLLKKQGKIRSIAASNFPTWRLAQANLIANNMNLDGFNCLQQRHTYLEPSLRSSFGNQLLINPEVEDYCGSNNIVLMGYSPLISGAYSDSKKSIPNQYESSNSQSRLSTLLDMAKELGITANQLVLAWMLNSTPRVLPMISASNTKQLLENLAASEIKLSSEQMEKLNTVNSTKVY